MISNQIQKKAELLKFLLKYSEVNNSSSTFSIEIDNTKLFEVEAKINTLNQTQETTYGMASSINPINNNNTTIISGNSIANPFTKPRKQLAP